MIDRINALLPQTQCGQCGFKGCKPYAEAIAAGTADINQCPPGGDEGIIEIARLLGVPSKPLNTRFGRHKPKQVAFIIEDDCIGCTKCIAACPVDAILGASKCMHTVIASECTGCELCISPCPVDCIVMKPAPQPAQKAEQAQKAMRRYEARCLRQARAEAEKAERARKKKEALLKLKSFKR
ncbi:electron transport complex subunit RsxB [Methylobacter sp. BBA5.1]|uniref:electron transport complex subunit RsxB n=1 Tax=Methylobacter sp. BBA5.1 TaxID=1495064 RepID=UPI0005694ED7|nr:electron transport complex subunit RsxB [Methylobacter sp. BBA5.1]